MVMSGLYLLCIRDVSLLFFFFNDAASTDIYTYLHTLSLHDAHPISLLSASESSNCTGSLWMTSRNSTAIDLRLLNHWRRIRVSASRPEEHTSELQSLMRISYEDFCLKKNKLGTLNVY